MTDDTTIDLSFDPSKPEIISPVKNGVFYESDTKNGMRSAPYFSIRIDGIEEAGA